MCCGHEMGTGAWKTVGVPRSRSRGAVSGAPRRRRARARVMAPRVAPPATGPDSYKVWEIKTQARKGTSKEDDARARELLERTAWQVQPIMRKRGWRVGVLLEMPAKVRDRLGDNYNRGERVRLKLRRDDGAWEAYEQVLAVMLHELVHNAIGPHDGKFFALLAELEKECEDLMARGIGGTGAGFDAKGARLGHRGGWGGIETRDAKTAAIDAARRRAAQHAAMGPPGGRRLGGGGDADLKSPRSAAAEAAERRARAEAFAKEHGLMDDVVVLSDDEDDDEDEDEARRGARARPRAKRRGDEKKEDGKKRKPEGEGPFSFRRGAKAVGSCPCCAAARADDAHVTMCRAEEATRATAATGRRERGKENAREKTRASISSPSKRSRPPEDVIVIDDSDDDASPRDASRYGASARKRQTPRSPARAPAKTWQCGACTMRNPESNSNCAACDRWRFSRGAPAASRPTGFGVDD